MEITSHKVNPANDRIRVVGTEDHFGTNHTYIITSEDSPEFRSVVLEFQAGPINESGVNGLTHEVLLAIIEDRLKSFQQGDFACQENAMALQKIQEAMMWLHKRTLNRMNRGVEGTHTV